MTREEILKDIKENPDKHKHNFHELTHCCFVNGAIDLSIMEAHKNIFGRGHDVKSGPCSCGATH